MSMAVLLQAVRDRVKAILSWDDSQVNVALDGQPPPFSGQQFAVVHPGALVNSAMNYLDEKYDVSITVTLRSDYSPPDRLGAEILVKATTGLYATVEALRAGLHMDYTGTLGLCGGSYGAGVWAGGQSYSLPATVNGFVEPLMFQRAGKPEPKGPDWFWAAGEDGDEATTGVAVQIDLVGARRIQKIEQAT